MLGSIVKNTHAKFESIQSIITMSNDVPIGLRHQNIPSPNRLQSRINDKINKNSRKARLNMLGYTIKNTHAKFESILSIRSLSNYVPTG